MAENGWGDISSRASSLIHSTQFWVVEIVTVMLVGAALSPFGPWIAGVGAVFALAAVLGLSACSHLALKADVTPERFSIFACVAFVLLALMFTAGYKSRNPEIRALREQISTLDGIRSPTTKAEPEDNRNIRKRDCRHLPNPFTLIEFSVKQQPIRAGLFMAKVAGVEVRTLSVGHGQPNLPCENENEILMGGIVFPIESGADYERGYRGEEVPPLDITPTRSAYLIVRSEKLVLDCFFQTIDETESQRTYCPVQLP